MPRLLLVSNRLPLTFTAQDGKVEIKPSAGGLATGLSGPHQQSQGLWIGWPGDVSGLGADERGALDRELAKNRTVPVHLTARELAGYYEGFSNRVLWPLFHYLVDHVPIEALEWNVYRDVNQKFADAVVASYRPGDVIWVHDYQLCLVPGMLRARLPDARIGFFLHIPFPSSEVLQALPWRNALLEGLLGADLIGFHTYPYARHFSNALLRLLGVPADVDRVVYRGREVRFGAYPMGIDAQQFSREAATPETEAAVAALREESKGQKLLLAIDRLDYTKGIRRRMLALEKLLEREPALRGKLKLIQIAVPSRASVQEYEEFRQDVDEVVGRINGQFGTTGWMPVHYLYRGFAQRELAAFYRAADAMLVTPLRDGMNLVAKEFVASRVDERGVLILSELAGASAELGQALLVNPYDVEGMGAAIQRALAMGEREQQIRMRALRERVLGWDVHAWVRTFLEDLGQRPPVVSPQARFTTPRELDAVAAQLRAAPRRVFLLDCDGTLLSLAPLPDLAGPDSSLRELLARLSSQRGSFVHLVSGRPRQTLEGWFGDLSVGLYAEHGLWSRTAPGEQWRAIGPTAADWKAKVRPILDHHAARTPGSFVEEKSASLGWHFRMADPEFGRRQAKDLQLLLRDALSNLPVEILNGDHLLEIRPHGVNKGVVVALALEAAGSGALALAMGDDQTDEDMFQALPQGGIAIHVGPRASRAPYRVEDPQAVRRFLESLL